MADEPRGLPVPQARPGAAQNVGVAVAQIPRRLVGGTAIKVTPDGLSYSVSLDISELGEAPATDLAATWVPAWIDDSAGQTYRVTLASLSVSLPIPWENITGKPATFPPTLPIPSSGVTGLDGALAAIALDLTGLDTRLDTAESTIATHTSEISANTAAISSHETRLDTIDGKLVDTDRGDIVTTSAFMVWTIDANAVDNTKLRDSAALSVIGRSANSAGDPADIAAAADGYVLRRSGTALGFGTIATAGYADDSVTNAKLANVPTATFKGRATGGTGDPEDLTATQATALLNAFTGDSGAGGAKGLVPAPGAGDAAAGKVLGAGGAWVTQAALAGKTLIGVQIFTASGTWNKPAGCNAVEVFVWGGGGSGASAAATAAGQGSTGSGGGGGGYAYEFITSLPNASEAVTVGSGGASPAAGANNGNAGGTSSFGSVPYLSATGGQGGIATATTANNFNPGGAGGVGSGGGFNANGEQGGVAYVATAAGAVARYSGKGGNAPCSGGGGLSIAGGTSSAGGVGSGPGAGGGGALSWNGAAAAQGGGGANGLVIVKSYG